MRTIRRLYFYLLALIGSQAVVWGAVNLLRTLFDRGVSGPVTVLATGLSLVIVGLPVFLLHWQVAQRDASRDEEEQASRIRAIFLYAVRVWTLIPILYSLLALFNRLLAGWMGLSVSAVSFGGAQSNRDNLISVAVNLIVFLYFSRVLAADWRNTPAGHFLAETRRLYRYLWVLFGLSVVVFAVQGLLNYLLNFFVGVGSPSGYLLANSLALALVGAPTWGYTWWLIQEIQGQPMERESILRLVVLYLISLAGVVGVLASGGRVLTDLFALLLGRAETLASFLGETAPFLSVLIPLAVMWAYYGRILENEMAELAGQPRRLGVQRLYRALLSALGLATSFTGLVTLIGYVSNGVFTASSIVAAWGELNSGLAALVIGLPLWLQTWTPTQVEASTGGETGERARRSLVRRASLYLYVFLFVVLAMWAAGDLLYNLISDLLGSAVLGIAPLVLQRGLTVVLIAAFLVYYLRILRQDARASQEALNRYHASFPVGVIIKDERLLADAIVGALKRQAPHLPVTIYPLDGGAPVGETSANRLVVLPGRLAMEPSDQLSNWLSQYAGGRLIVPQPREGWVWLGVTMRPVAEQAEEAAVTIRQMAEGDAPRGGLPASPWAIAGYILGGLFSLQALALLFVLLVSSLFNG